MSKEEVYWAWYDEEGNYRYIYPKRFLVEMCSPDGFKKAIEQGKGKIIKVSIKECKRE